MIHHHEARGRCVSNTQGSVAQLVERATENRKVTGSTPVGATIRPPGFYSGGGFFFNRALLSSLRILYLVHYILCARILFLLKEP